MVRQRLAFTVTVIALLAGCTSEAPPPAPEPPERKPTVFDDQLEALDKAKALQQELDEAARKRDEAAREQEG